MRRAAHSKLTVKLLEGCQEEHFSVSPSVLILNTPIHCQLFWTPHHFKGVVQFRLGAEWLCRRLIMSMTPSAKQVSFLFGSVLD